MAPSKDSVVADHVIVDSAGFINNAPINDLSENVYCISEVVSEIRDKATKQRLQVLPYTINFREPSSESISVVNTFAKKTGDYRSLSRTDIKLIALTYQLQKEKAGVSHLRTSPLCRPESVVIPTKKSEQQDAHIAGFYLGDLKTGENTSEKKKVVDDLINSLEKLKVAVQEVKTDFTLSPRDPVDPSSLTSNETVYGSFNYWRNPLPEFELFQELESCSPLFGVNRSSDRKPSVSKPPLPPKPFCLTSPTKSHPDPLSPLLIPPPKSVGLTANQNGVSHEIVTSPDFDDFLFWKSDICLSPEEIHYELVSGGELEKADEEKEVTSWGDAGRIARQNGDVAVIKLAQGGPAGTGLPGASLVDEDVPDLVENFDEPSRSEADSKNIVLEPVNLEKMHELIDTAEPKTVDITDKLEKASVPIEASAAVIEAPAAVIEPPTELIEAPTELIEAPTELIEALEPAAVIEASEPVAVIEASEPVAVIEAAEPAAVIKAPEPAAATEAPEPLVEAPEPVAVVESPEPVAVVEAPGPVAVDETVAVIEAPEPVAVMDAPEPAAVIKTPEPAVVIETPVLGAVIEASEPAAIIKVLDPVAVTEAPSPAAVVEAPVEVMEAPARVMEAPAAVIEALAVLIEAPAVVIEAPAAVIEAPAAVIEAPEAVLEAPEAVLEAPEAVLEAPEAVLEAPEAVLEAPEAVLEAPEAVIEAPAAVIEAPAAVIETPTAVFEAPTAVFEAPAALIEAPAVLIESPPPAAVIEAPAAAIEAPAAVIEAPAAVIEPPETVIEPPKAVIEGPAAVIETSAAVIEAPAAVIEAPVPAAVIEDPAPASSAVKEVPQAALDEEQDKHDLQSLLEGRVVQGGDEDTSDEEEEEDLVDFDSSGFGGGSESSGLGGGWITPKNLAAVKQEQTGGGADQDQTSVPVAVACLTTDFAMQNVLIQMGLNVIGVNGKVIKRARSYALRCYGCFKLTFNLEKQFCPHCGNQTLKRVSIKVNDDGSLQYFISLRKPISAKGKNKSLPPPKGGKHSTDPIVFEDQRVPHNRASKMATQSNLDAFDADFVARDSPFAVNDVNSRAAMMGINRRSSGGGGGGARGNRKRRR